MNPWTPRDWFARLRSFGAKAAPMTSNEIVRYAQQLGSEFRMAEGQQFDEAHLLALAREVAVSAAWCRSGFPTIELSDQLFASLMCTSVPPELLPDIGTPWDTFVVRIPERFQVEVDFGWGPGVQPLVYMLYNRIPGSGGGNFMVSPLGTPGAGFATGVTSMADLLRELDDTGSSVRDDNFPWMKDCPVEVTFKDPTLLYRRAFVGACIEMMSPANASLIAQRKREGIRYKRGAPRGWTFRLTRDVKVDCRERAEAVLRASAAGKRVGQKLAVQSLVRGHWKRQPCGAAGSERKFIHVEPYWRGPEDADIALRSHVLKKPDAA